MSSLLPPFGNTFISTKTSSSPLTTGTLFTFTKGIIIRGIYGTVSTIVQAQTTNTKISVKNDALTAVDLCANADLTGAAAGTLLHITGTATDILQIHALGADANSNSLPYAGIAAIPTTSGVITVTYSAASTGVIKWYMVWSPLVAGATVS